MSASASKSFNYARAWREVAEPAFRLLPTDVHALFVDVSAAYGDTHQMKNLEMPWLPGFRERFDAIDTATLAHAASAVNYYGHWNPNGGNVGETWKFSNLCDQVITERLWPNMPHIRPHSDSGSYSVSYKVLEGALRLCLSRETKRDGSYWMWREIGYASAELLAALQSTNPKADSDPDAELDRVQSAPQVAALAAAPAPWGALLHPAASYMEEQQPCVKCGSRDPQKYSYGMFFASELCARGECKRDCTCYLLDIDHHVLRAELLEVEAAKLEERDGEELRRAVHEQRLKARKSAMAVQS